MRQERAKDVNAQRKQCIILAVFPKLELLQKQYRMGNGVLRGAAAVSPLRRGTTAPPLP